MEEMIARNPIVRCGRAALSFVVLSVFVLLPTLRLKSRFALAVARMPVWRRYEFFRAMFKVIDQQGGRREAS